LSRLGSERDGVDRYQVAMANRQLFDLNGSHSVRP
jgi:hypothetical protein